MKILVSGSIAYDRIMDFPGYFKDHILPEKIHNISVSFFIEKLSENFGGTAGNIAYNLALLGEEPIIFSAVGNDFEEYRNWLERHNVDTSKIKLIEDSRTAMATMITDKADNQISAFCPGAMVNSCAIEYAEEYKNSIAIIAAGVKEDMINHSKFYFEHNIPFIFDPGQQITSFGSDELTSCIKKAKFFISNDYELSMALKKTKWSEHDILENVDILVTTLCESGSIIKTKNEVYQINSAIPKSISDPTGAGDAYRAGFIKGMINNWPLQVAGEFAGVVACYAIENYGTQNHKFDFEAIKKRYEENFNKKLTK